MAKISAETLQNALINHLGLNETATVILPAHVAANSSDEHAPNRSSERQMRILAVVSNYQHAEEEGSILIFKPRVTVEDQVDVLLLWAAPLTSELSISMAQSRARSGTIDLRPGKYTVAAPPQMLLTLDLHGQKQTFIVPSTEELRGFVNECRRLIKISNTAATLDFGWLNYYTSQCVLRREMPQLFPRPDLRELRKSPFNRLSRASAGQPGDEDFDIACIRDEWIRTEMNKEKDKYSKAHNVKVRIGTFNVNGRLPSQDLSPWIRPQHQRKATLPPLKSVSPLSLSALNIEDYVRAGGHDDSSDEESDGPPSDNIDHTEPDLIVVGFQELDLSTEALIYSYTTTREDAWVDAIFASLGEVRDQYIKVASKQLVGMLTILIAKKDLVKHISDIRTCAVGTGIMGMMGNKGASAVRITLYSTVMTFVNSHLAAYDEYTEKRNADFHDLSRRLVFSTAPSSGTTSELTQSGNSVYSGVPIRDQAESAFQADIVFWMGDLNYRVDLPDSDVRELIGGGPREYNMRDMLEHDQLTKSRREGRVFEGFQEGLIRHNPTYRFKVGQDIAADTLGYDLKRRPAWTDRILQLSDPDMHVKQFSYDPHFEITMSDHRPVSATFSVPVRSIDETCFHDQASELFNKLGDFEDAEEMPKLKVSLPEINFGQIWYKKKYSQKLRLDNIGKVACAFRFVPLNEMDPILPRWLTVSSQMGIILPNEHICVTLTIFVDDESANKLNLEVDKLQHTLILHTVRGKDHFIIVSGRYQPTCFANELETLVRLPGPIRSIDSGITLSKEPRSNAPNEIIRLINWLMTNAIDILDLYKTKGNRRLVEFIRECLDTGHEFIFGTSEEKRIICLSFGEALLQFLQSLPTSIVPAYLHQRCSYASNRDEAFEIISELPSHSLNVWISLTAYLHYYAQRQHYSQEGGVEAARETTACIFAPILMRDNARIAPPVSPLAKRRFLGFFLQ